MKLLPEDPRITAYALGEIEDAKERAEIEAAVAESAELQQVVSSIREMGDLLAAGLATEAAPELSEFEKARMELPAGAAVPRPSFVGKLWAYWPQLAGVAAVLALAAVIIAPQTKTQRRYSYDVPREEVSLPSEDHNVPQLADTLRTVESSAAVMDPQTAEGDDAKRQIADFDGELRIADEVAVVVPAPKPLAAPKKPEGLVAYDDFAKDHENQAAPAARARLEAQAGEQTETWTLSSSQTTGLVAFGYDDRVVGRASSDVDAFASTSTLAPPPPPASVRATMRSMPRPSAVVPPPDSSATWNTESYDPIEGTGFRSPLVAPLSTFSIDVDTASYANVRRFLNQGQLPPSDAVRIEELINYFPYDDAAPSESLDEGGDPFAVHMAQTFAPWHPQNRLLRIALKGYEMPWDERPASNLVFLLDVSGSMNSANKLPLVKEAMDLLIRRLDERDRVAIVVYAGASGLVLPSTTANNRETIAHALQNLQAGGSTNAGAGIELAYKTARQHFIEGGNNRVILCTDGDFNVGRTNRGDLAQTAESEAEQGVSLTILGFGMGNYKDDMLETLSNKGKGTYAYVDSSAEARKVFLEDLAGNIFKIAKDVKIQVEFNPAVVQAYRLIGYENRRLKAEDFNNDSKKAGDIGPGHSVVALYEIVPVGGAVEPSGVDALRYQRKVEAEPVEGEVATVKLRYKQPDGDVSKLITHTVSSDEISTFDAGSDDLRFTAAVAAFGMRLSGFEGVADFSFDQIEAIAASAIGNDSGGHRSEFTDLVRKAEVLSK